MKKILGEIQSGEFAQEWIAENEAGRPNFKKLQAAGREHPIEAVGEQLRAMMPWISQGKAKPQEVSGGETARMRMLDHLSIQCADFDGGRGVLRRGARPVGGKRILDFGPVIGYGTDFPCFWIGPPDHRRREPRGAHRVHRADTWRGRRVRAHAGAGAEVLHPPGSGPSTTSTTTAGSCATPTATTSRPSATRRPGSGGCCVAAVIRTAGTANGGRGTARSCPS